MKKIICVALACITLSFVCGGCYSYKSLYFDLSDEKVIFDESALTDEIVQSACLGHFIIQLKKPKEYVKLRAKDFRIKNIVEISYNVFSPDEDRLNDEEYMENFRQELNILVSGVNSFEEHLAIIRKIEKIDFVKEVSFLCVVLD